MTIAALISSSSLAKDGDDPTVVNSWYAQTVARSSAGLNVNYFWSLGSKFRAETVVSGHKVVTIVSGDTYYAYDAVLMNGVAIRRAAAAIAADSSVGRPFGNEVELLLGEGAEKVREEILFGAPSEVYQLSDDTGRRVLWVTQDSRRLPMRVEIYNRRTGSTSYKEYFDWRIGMPISEKFFEPDSAAELRHFEFDEYIGSADDKEIMGLAPILYEHLLIGETGTGGDARVSSPR